MSKKKPSLADFRFAGALYEKGAGRDAEAFDLTHFDPSDKPFSSGDKADDKAAVDALALELDALQNLFYADGRFKLLVVLQGTDTAGKDGTIRGVFGQMTPLGVRTIGWKAPTGSERDHDYLWRIHQQVPANGQVMIFNRSHYEDVLVPPVSGWITPEQTRQRYAHINDFERMLTETGTVIVCCTSRRRNRPSACRNGSMTRRKPGSSSKPTSKPERTGRLFRKHTAR